MKPENAIEVEDLTKVFYVAATAAKQTRGKQLVRNLTSPLRRLRATLSGQSAFGAEVPLTVLDRISFEVKKGQIIGIIGSNGSGKSTLLKILSRITLPTSGVARVRGKVGSLLEVGTGFHPDLTGRENMYMNGAVLGMTKHDINRRFDEILAFSGVGAFIDTPVKRYSSGMRVRLAFAVSAFFEPEVLLVDEVLSVGDAEFQKRGLGKMAQVSREGRTVVMVSHKLSTILTHCDSVLWINKGKLMEFGDPNQVVSSYLMESSMDSTLNEGEKTFSSTPAESEYPFKLVAMRTLDAEGSIRSSFLSSSPVVVEMEVEMPEPIPFIQIGFELKTSEENTIFRTYHNDLHETLDYQPGTQTYRLRGVIPAHFLNKGSFYIDPVVAVHRRGWVVQNVRGLTVHVVLDTPNRDYAIKQRMGVLAPMLEWHAENEPVSKA